jgi:hypothetical protein
VELHQSTREQEHEAKCPDEVRHDAYSHSQLARTQFADEFLQFWAHPALAALDLATRETLLQIRIVSCSRHDSLAVTES